MAYVFLNREIYLFDIQLSDTAFNDVGKISSNCDIYFILYRNVCH